MTRPLPPPLPPTVTGPRLTGTVLALVLALGLALTLSLAVSLLAAAPAGAQEPSAAREQAGTATAAVPLVEAALRDQAVRRLEIGAPVYRQERVSTGPEGHLHVVFLDESNLTVGPNSAVVIDRFVYDPAASTGELALRQASGVLRFIGGAISKSGEVEVDTPVASIGIRGGIAVVQQLPGGGTRVFFLFGERLSAENRDGERRVLEEAGFSLTIGPDGRIGPPEPIDPEALAGALALLERPGGATRASLPDGAIRDLHDRLRRRGVDPGPGRRGGLADPITPRELETLLGVPPLDEGRLRDLYEGLTPPEPAFDPQNDPQFDPQNDDVFIPSFGGPG